MAPVRSLQELTILIRALPCANELSDYVKLLIGRLLEPERRELPKRTDPWGKHLHRFQGQAKEGTLSEADGAWFDFFLGSRENWATSTPLAGE